MIDTPLPGLPPALQRALADKPGMAAAWQQRQQAKTQQAKNAARPSSPSQRLTESAPSVTAHDGHDDASAAITLDDAALEDWANSLTTRIGLQSELVWVGLNDGYTDAGGRDVAIPYLGLYWLLGHTIKGQHCQSCLLLSFGNPYDPPGTPGGKTIDQAPGDGHTECGAGCKCWLEYGLPNVSLPRNYVWRNNVFPGPGKATPEIGQAQLDREAAARAKSYSWDEAMVLSPESEYFTDEQKGALDLFRAKWFAWEDVRGELPQAPKMFAELEEADSLMDLDMRLNDMTDQQRDILFDLQSAINEWNQATTSANATLDEAVPEE